MRWAFVALAAALVVNLAAKVETNRLQFNAWPIWLTLAACALAWLAAILFWRTMLAPFGAQHLATIGLFAAVQFTLSYATRLAFGPINVVAGPYAVYLTGFGDEGLRCLLLGALVALIPRPGTFALSTLAVFVFNSLTSGFLGFDGLAFVTLTIVLGEAALAGLRVTTGPTAKAPSPTAGWSLIWRAATAIGVANGLKMLLQFQLNGVLYRFFFADAYVLSVSGLALAYGMLGAMAGVPLGYRLRRTAP
jgi:hypothetical protein